MYLFILEYLLIVGLILLFEIFIIQIKTSICSIISKCIFKVALSFSKYSYLETSSPAYNKVSCILFISWKLYFRFVSNHYLGVPWNLILRFIFYDFKISISSFKTNLLLIYTPGEFNPASTYSANFKLFAKELTIYFCSKSLNTFFLNNIVKSLRN